MNKIEVFIDNNGTWESVKNKANVVGLTVSQLLDEALDEARMVIKNSANKNYSPLTDIRVDFYEDNIKVDEEYFCIGDPKSEEYPIKKD